VPRPPGPGSSEHWLCCGELDHSRSKSSGRMSRRSKLLRVERAFIYRRTAFADASPACWSKASPGARVPVPILAISVLYRWDAWSYSARAVCTRYCSAFAVAERCLEFRLHCQSNRTPPHAQAKGTPPAMRTCLRTLLECHVALSNCEACSEKSLRHSPCATRRRASISSATASGTM